MVSYQSPSMCALSQTVQDVHDVVCILFLLFLETFRPLILLERSQSASGVTVRCTQGGIRRGRSYFGLKTVRRHCRILQKQCFAFLVTNRDKTYHTAHDHTHLPIDPVLG